MKLKKTFLFLITCSFIFSGCVSTQQSLDITPVQPPSKQSINSVIASLAKQITTNMIKQKKSKVAVTNFLTLEGCKVKIGLFLSDKLTNSLFQFGDKFEVVERRRMEALMKEISLGMTGLIDDSTAQDVGKATGADAIVIGTITDLGEEVDISIRMLDTETAAVIAVASASMGKNAAVARLLATPDCSKPSPMPKPVFPVIPGDSVDGEPETKSKPSEENERLVETEGFLFKLQECKRAGSSVKCSLLITNKEADRTLWVHVNSPYGYSRTFDYLGNEYKTSTAKFANSQTEKKGYFLKKLIKKIPTKLIFSFKGVSSQIEGLSILELNFALESSLTTPATSVQFRDVLIKK